MLWLGFAAMAVGAGIALAFAVGRSPLALGAWALAGPIAIGALAVFTRADLDQRTRPVYDARDYVTAVYGFILVAAAFGVLWSGWLFANWWARR